MMMMVGSAAGRMVHRCVERNARGIAIRFASSLVSVSFPSGNPCAVWLMGVPGSGKTYALKRIFPSDCAIQLLDLDLVMKHHPEYDPNSPSDLYEKKQAYSWANEQIEAELARRIDAPKRGDIIVVDGTGSHCERNRRRMQMTRAAGFTNMCLFVDVTFETAMRRNATRDRQVPKDIMTSYLSKVEDAVAAMRSDPLVDQFLVLDNNVDDGLAGRERWESNYEKVWEESVRKGAFFTYKQ